MPMTPELGEPRSIELSCGRIAYRERGSGPALVFVHGVGVTGDLWRNVAPSLAEGHRIIVPDWPLGAHRDPLRPATDMSLPGLAAIVREFLEALTLDDVTLVANDTGGAISQWLVGHDGDRIGRLVLTSCDAFDRYPPRPQRLLAAFARLRPLLGLLGWAMRFRAAQRLPIAYGLTTHRPLDEAVMAVYTKGVRTLPGVRADLRRILLAARAADMFEAALRLPRFDRPALVVWGADDVLFPPHYGELLAELLPRARFVALPDCRTFVPEEQPERLVQLVAEFVEP